MFYNKTIFMYLAEEMKWQISNFLFSLTHFLDKTILHLHVLHSPK